MKISRKKPNIFLRYVKKGLYFFCNQIFLIPPAPPHIFFYCCPSFRFDKSDFYTYRPFGLIT